MMSHISLVSRMMGPAVRSAAILPTVYRFGAAGYSPGLFSLPAKALSPVAPPQLSSSAGTLAMAAVFNSKRFVAGSRNVFQVSRGRFWLFVGVVGSVAAAAIMQEILGPYVFFREKS
eukprot:TRINITY_DN42789_c0_g1_i1.p1 TRINITY_DN42789_c0_g1~~TRINITY_DN42789_c0_g1_i1.p1  ORF type:complete len:117 (-),score=12.57 TRINITY_DN42789_c0_g1_i1:132-482(-)